MQHKISVIIPTIGRSAEINLLLKSICLTNIPINEVIIVDQNCNTIIDDVVKIFDGEINILHLKVDFRGASKARNYGTLFATGEYICFPDDDAEFLGNTIEKALNIIERENVQVVFGRCVDRNNNNSVSKFVNHEGYLTLRKYEGMFVESTIFINKSLFLRYLFDEKLGVGTLHGAEEGHDLVLRLLNDKIRIFYSPDLLFYHPSKILTHTNEEEIRRAFYYRSGYGRLCRKHRLTSKWLKRFSKVSIYIIYLAVFNNKKCRYYIAEWLGLLTGIVIK